MVYKQNKKILILSIIIILLFIALTYILPISNKTNLNVKNSDKIIINMKKDEVLQIMGPPDSKQLSFFNNIDTMYYYEPPFGASSGIYIQFDDSLDIVNHIIPYE